MKQQRAAGIRNGSVEQDPGSNGDKHAEESAGQNRSQQHLEFMPHRARAEPDKINRTMNLLGKGAIKNISEGLERSGGRSVHKNLRAAGRIELQVSAASLGQKGLRSSILQGEGKNCSAIPLPPFALEHHPARPDMRRSLDRAQRLLLRPGRIDHSWRHDLNAADFTQHPQSGHHGRPSGR